MSAVGEGKENPSLLSHYISTWGCGTFTGLCLRPSDVAKSVKKVFLSIFFKIFFFLVGKAFL